MKIKDTSNGKSFTPCPEFTGRAVCVDVTELKKVNTKYGEREIFKLVFEVDQQREDGTRFAVWSQGFTPSLHEKSGLRKFLRGWFGRDLSETELRDFETETLLGRPAFLVVTHTTSDNDVYANIASCTPYKGNDPLQPSGNFVRAKDRPPKDSNGGANYRRIEQAETNPAAEQEQDILATKIHIGSMKGLEVRDLSPDQIAPIIDKWLPKAKANPKPTADDRRLIAALEKYNEVNAVADNVPF